MILADTGFFIAMANPKDHLHKRAMAWTARLAEPLLVTESVLFESINALSRKEFRFRTADLIRSIFSGNQIAFEYSDPASLSDALSMHQQYADKEWSLTDCVSFSVMKRRGIVAALSHDQHFVQAGYDALLQRDP